MVTHYDELKAHGFIIKWQLHGTECQFPLPERRDKIVQNTQADMYNIKKWKVSKF